MILYLYLSFASSTFEGQGARSGGQEECSVRLFAIFVCMSKVSSCSLLLAPCSLTQLLRGQLLGASVTVKIPLLQSVFVMDGST